MKTCVEIHGIGNQKIPMAIIDDTVYMSVVFWENYLTPNHSYLSQLDVTYKTPDLMSYFLP
ncbi:hypothetical protein, partial [Streptococcus pneumoniae]